MAAVRRLHRTRRIVSAIFVTGGAGFVGSALVRMLIRDTDLHVVNIDKLTYAANLESLAPVEGNSRYHFERADICDAARMRALFARYAPAGVVHLAAESHVDRSIDGPGMFVQTNVIGTYTMLSCAMEFWRTLGQQERDVFRFVNVSTDEVYGTLGDEGLFAEESPYDPRSPYSASKAGADHLVGAWYHTYDFPAITTNSSNNYGPYQFPEKLIPLVIDRARKGQPVPVYGNGLQVRDWLHVDDHASALLAVFRRGVPGRTYNVGARNERRNIDVVRAICDTLDELAPDAGIGPRRSLISHVTDRPGHDVRYAIDASRIAAELHWRASTPFEHGLRQTVQWYIDNAPWVQRIHAGSYGGERLGLGVAEQDA